MTRILKAPLLLIVIIIVRTKDKPYLDFPKEKSVSPVFEPTINESHGMYPLGFELFCSTLFVRFFKIVMCSCSLLILKLRFCDYITLYVFIFIDGHLGSFHLGVMDDASTNILLSVFGEYMLVIYLREEQLSR